MLKTKKMMILLGLGTSLFASELQYGSGTFGMEGGFLGLTGRFTTDIESFSLADRHSNFGGKYFYSYDFTWYDSTKLRTAQHTYNEKASAVNGMAPIESSPFSVPEMEYRVKGLDANIKIGYDVIHQDADNFLGLGLLVGLSMPWIDASNGDNPTDNTAVPSFDFYTANLGTGADILKLFEKSQTEIMTYKIGPTINMQKSLIAKKLSLYALASYAYQTGYIKNDYANSDFTVNGTFQEYNIGLYFTPFTETYKWGWLSISPRVYATIGYKYASWDLDEMVIDISGAKLSSDILDPLAMKFGMDTSVGYVGIGYSF